MFRRLGFRSLEVREKQGEIMVKSEKVRSEKWWKRSKEKEFFPSSRLPSQTPLIPPYEGGLYIGIIEQERSRRK